MIITDVFARSSALLASQFQERLPVTMQNPMGLTNFQKLIYCFCTAGQDVQNVLQELLTERYLNVAVGTQLDGIGQIVGLARIPGQPDDTNATQTGYREDLQFKIFYNSSNATPEEIIAIAAYITDSTHVNYIEYYPAAYEVLINGIITNGFFENYAANSIPTLLKNAGPAGVAYPPIITTMGVPKPFSFSSDVLLEPLYASTTVELPSPLQPFEVDPGAGAEQFYVQRGETFNPITGGGFSEWNDSEMINETEGAGQLCEVVQLNGNLPP